MISGLYDLIARAAEGGQKMCAASAPCKDMIHVMLLSTELTALMADAPAKYGAPVYLQKT